MDSNIGRRELKQIKGITMFEFFSKWKKQRNTIRELNSLTDRELTDLGIHRSDIRKLVKGL